MSETATSRIRNRLRVVIAICVMLTVPAVVVVALAARPLDLRRIDAQQEPFETHGPALRGGCGLNQEHRDGGCVVLTTVFESQPVRFASRHPERGIAELAGTLTIPGDVAGKRPGAVLIGGSGPTDRDGVTTGDLVVRHRPFPLLKQTAELLSRQGIVVLRYDKRSCGRCYPTAAHNTKGFRFAHLVDDARDAVRYLAAREEVDAHNIVVIGHSQGGQLAPVVANAEPRVAAVVMLAATTQTLEAGLTGQLERVAELRREQYDVFGMLRARSQADHHRACFHRMRTELSPDEVCVGGGITQQALAEGEDMARATLAEVAALKVPVLAIQGTLDRNIDPAVITELRDVLAARVAAVHYVSGVSHSLVDAYQPAHPRLAAAVEAALVSFLGATPTRSRSLDLESSRGPL